MKISYGHCGEQNTFMVTKTL